ncbi:MAG: sulfatase-like hydrolase/transferase [Verrucomicrobiota bacterium]
MQTKAIHSLSLFILLLICLSACTSERESAANHAPAVTPPNILWIITDDHRSDSLAYYNEVTTGKSESRLGYVFSPHIDALAREGVIFTEAYCNSPACAPSRSSMHTGKYPHRNGMYGFRKAYDNMVTSSVTIPEIMNAHGYQSAHFGKRGYYIFKGDDKSQWEDLGHYQPSISHNDLAKTEHSDYWFNKPWGSVNGKGMVTGTEEVYRFPGGEVKRFWRERKDQPLTDEDRAKMHALEAELDILRSYPRSNPTLIIGGVSSHTTENTLDGAIVKSFRQHLQNPNQSYQTILGTTEQGPDSSKPLFVHLGFHFPHTPVLPSKEFRDQFKDKVYDIPEFTEVEVERMPENLQFLHQDMNFSQHTDEEKQQAVQDYYAFCAMGDKLVGDAIQAFKDYCAQHQQEYVIVFVCGDHGWHLGEQGIKAKFGPWYQSTHGSVIIASSDKQAFPPGTVNTDLVEYVDFAPTFYDLAQVPDEARSDIDGLSLIGTLDGNGIKRDYVIGEMNQVRGARVHLRSKDFAFCMLSRPYFTKPGEGYAPGERIRWGLDAPREEVDLSLYDLRVDPDERVNVANEPAYRELADFLRQKLGNIVLGDRRLEVDWRKDNVHHLSDFAVGAHDFKLVFPEGMVPEPQVPMELLKP